MTNLQVSYLIIRFREMNEIGVLRMVVGPSVLEVSTEERSESRFVQVDSLLIGLPDLFLFNTLV